MKSIFKNPVIIIICVASIFFGGIMLYLGFDQLNEISNRPESSDTVPGFLNDYEVIEQTANGTKYRLEYVYYVGNAEYKLYAQTIQETEPELNKRVNIICDLYNPKSAQLEYEETYPMLILAGALMCVIPIIFLLAALITSGIISFHHINLIEIATGVIFIGFGLLFNYAFCKTFSPIKAFKAGRISAIFPVAFLAAGGFLILKGLFLSKKNQNETT